MSVQNPRLLLALASRGNGVTVPLGLSEHVGCVLIVRTTVIGTSLQPTLRQPDNGGGLTNIWQPAAIAGTGTAIYLLYPGASGGSYTAIAGIAVPSGAILQMDVVGGNATYEVEMIALP